MYALQVGRGSLEVRKVPVPFIADEALVRVIRSGICNTDLEIARGYAGFEGTIGHEFVGIVEHSTEDPGLVGKRVVGEINAGCGKCRLCLGDDPRHCPTRTVLGIKGRDGAHAGFLTLPARNLIEVPANVSDEAAVFVEPLAAANGITEMVEIDRATRVAVIGDGKLGLLCAFCISLKTERLVLFGKHKEKLGHAGRSGRSIETAIISDAGESAGAFDVVVEASGSESGFSSALDLVRPRGKIVLKSTFHGTPTWEASRVVVDEITVVGSRCGRFQPALELLANGSVRVDDLIDDVVDLKDGVAAMERAASRGTLKVLLSMN
jgi:threonine dehydrogenase-like Zn-dependent dehydrogenase